MRPQDLVGVDILVGLTYLDAEGKVLRQEQFHGTIDEVDEGTVRICPADGGERRWVLSAPKTLRPAPSGTYRLASTGQVVTDPTLITSWRLTVCHDPDSEMFYEVEPNYAPLVEFVVPREWEYTIRPDRIRRVVEMFGDEYIGRTLLLGVTYNGPGSETRHQEQLVGTIMVVEFDQGIIVSCEPYGRTFVLPGDPCWVVPTSLGEYRLRSTGQVVKDPDYIAKLTIGQPE